MTEEDDKYKELDPELRDWEYDGCGKKRHKKAFHLQYDELKVEIDKKEE